MKNLKRLFAFAVLVFTASMAFSAEGDAPKEKYVDPKPWTHKTERLTRPQLDKLLGHPEKLLFIDVRRPDEISKVGGFPIYLSIQTKDLEESLAYIPKGRQIVTISVRAHRAGDAGDFLISKGYKVAGAVGVKDYEDQGGSLNHVAIPAPKVAAAETPVAEKK